MRLSHAVEVAKSEYLQRAKTKAFWITTLILPVFVVAISIVPTLLIAKSKSPQRIVVVDDTGKLGPDLVKRLNSQETKAPKKEAPSLRRRGGEEGMITFEATAEPPAADRRAREADLDRRALGEELDARVRTGPGAFADTAIE